MSKAGKLVAAANDNIEELAQKIKRLSEQMEAEKKAVYTDPILASVHKIRYKQYKDDRQRCEASLAQQVQITGTIAAGESLLASANNVALTLATQDRQMQRLQAYGGQTELLRMQAKVEANSNAMQTLNYGLTPEIDMTEVDAELEEFGDFDVTELDDIFPEIPVADRVAEKN